MKAISIKDPWAELIANGEKTIETRTWKTKYRGKILVVASKLPKTKNSGLAIAVTEIVDCRPMELNDAKEACCNIYDRANSWDLKNTRRIKPFPIKGKLNVYHVDVDEKDLEYI